MAERRDDDTSVAAARRAALSRGPQVSRRGAVGALGSIAAIALAACSDSPSDGAGPTSTTGGSPAVTRSSSSTATSGPTTSRPRRAPSGVPMPQGSLPGWRQVIAEDFGTDVPVGGFVVGEDGLLTRTCRAYPGYGARLSAYQDGPTDNGGLYRTARTVSVVDSVLDIHVRFDRAAGKVLSAAIYPFRPGTHSNAHTYGRWSYRMRARDVTSPGIICVSLLFPETKSSWPRSGEVDWPESDVIGPLGGNNHPAGSAIDSRTEIDALGKTWSDWHTFTIEWRKNFLVYQLDGTTVFSTTKDVPTEPLKWDVQCSPDPQVLTGAMREASAHVQLDWVVAYDPA